MSRRLASRPTADGFGDDVREVGSSRQHDLLLWFEVVEQAAARDIGGLGDIVQGRRLEAALQKEANGFGLNPGVGLCHKIPNRRIANVATCSRSDFPNQSGSTDRASSLKNRQFR
jgi:hypothetical protein